MIDFQDYSPEEFTWLSILRDLKLPEGNILFSLESSYLLLLEMGYGRWLGGYLIVYCYC